jgi:WhiB family redox-sensing transcriptional regulator
MRREPCGTHAGYQTHLRHGEASCEPCRAANTEYNRTARETRKRLREHAEAQPLPEPTLQPVKPEPAVAVWYHRGACNDYDPEIWFPVNSRLAGRATEICDHRCPVKVECLRYALEEEIQHGVWGGLTEEERQELARYVRVRREVS